MTKVTDFFTKLMRKYLPDPFVFAIFLTIVTLILAITVQGYGFLTATEAWGNGFWNLLSFTTQMAVILAFGYVLAAAPVTDKFLNWIASKVNTPKQAIMVATLVGAIGSYLNWGFGLVIGGIVAKKLAYRVKGVHYPLIIAAAYSGFTLYGLGLSATIPVVISTEGHALSDLMGVIPLTQTLFHPIMLCTAALILITLPLLNSWLHPKPGQPVVEIDRAKFKEEFEPTAAKLNLDDGEVTFATRLNNSRILAYGIGLLGLIYVGIAMFNGKSVDLNLINFFILFVGIILLGSPAKYVEKLNEGIKTVSGILLQFPFYAGIMAIMTASGLVITIADLFVSFSTKETLPFWGYISSFVINFFAPSAGGHWVLQGPFQIEAAATLGSDIAANSVAVMLGNAWNDVIQPFWILPALAISKLKLRDIMGYLVVIMLWVGFVYGAAILLWGFLG